MKPITGNAVTFKFCLKLLTFALCLLTLLTPPGAAIAQNAAGITVTPITSEFEIKPGETKTLLVRVINPTASVLTLYPRVLNFHTDNDEGQPSFFGDDERSSSYALSQWVKPSRPFIRIAPNEDEQFELTVTAPHNAEPGGKYGAILFSTEEPKLDEDVSQVGVVGLVGTLLLARVSGEIRESTNIASFDVPSILFTSPANLSLLFSNRGNVHTKPLGEIKIRNWSGQSVSSQVVNEGRGNVLPESQRRFESKWQFDWKTVGRYSATAVITYGNPEQQLQATRTFYVIPYWLIAALATLILLLVIIPVVRRRGRKPTVKTESPLPSPPPPPNRRVMG
jgi:hypothetical protein